MKASALSILAKQEEKVKKDFEDYRTYVDNDVQGFISYISELKLKRNKGEEGPISFKDIDRWKTGITI